MVRELQPPKLNIERLYDSVVTQQLENYLIDQTADTLSGRPNNIDVHCAAIKNTLFPGVVVAHQRQEPNGEDTCVRNSQTYGDGRYWG